MEQAVTLSLTIGFICHNSARHLDTSLEHARALVEQRGDLPTQLVIVDSGSDDATADIISDFAKSNDHVDHLRITGQQNAAVARNVILDHVANSADTAQNAVFLVDSDVYLSPGFIEPALHEIEFNNADAVYGQLPEALFDASGNAVGSVADRYAVNDRHSPGWFKGVVLLSNSVVRSGLRYDASFERLEDIEFSLRVSEKFTIVAIPVPMGIHNTTSYHALARLPDFIRRQYQKPAGLLIRKYALKPAILWRVRRAFIGYLIGLVLWLLLIAGLVIGQRWLVGAAGLLIALDFARFALKGRLVEYLPLRVIGPVQILTGLVSPRPALPRFEVSEE